MPPRPTMVDLVDRIRSVTAAGETDEFQGQTFWSDDQLQAELDREKTLVYAERLVPVIRKIDSQLSYKIQKFTLPDGRWLEPVFSIRDVDGVEITVPTYTVEYSDGAGQVTFSAEPTTDTLYIDLITFDWNGAAAEIWKQKAAHRFDFIRVKGGDHQFDFEAEYKHCLARADFHASKRILTYQRRQGRFVVGSNQWTL